MKIDINKIKLNTNNPRIIKDNQFEKLVQSIKDFPEMLDKRPIVVDEDFVVLGGNMRLEACKKAGLKQVTIIKADNWTKEQKEKFIIKDNISFGDWDWDILANDWDNKELNDWGLNVWQPDENVDYSILDDIDLNKEIDTMYQQTKKSIILEYPAEGFEMIKTLYDELKAKEVNLSELFYKAMQKYDS
tara:strand:- start:1648 stop:2211 length:564 start_codon:yes stop_codon:yes gene_type:complete